MNDCPVSSHTEWQPLEEVILGDPRCFFNQPDDLSFRLFFHDNIFGRTWQDSTRDIDPEALDYRRHIEEMGEDLDAIGVLLEREGIVVRRPIAMETPLPFQTPHWSSGCIPCLNVRDLTLVVGQRIIETPAQVRSRYFEGDFLKPLFNEYFDRGAEWTTAPRPMLLDNSFDLSYVRSQGAQPRDYAQTASPFDRVGKEIMFDAAQCVRLGRDIVMNVSTENHRRGATWLQRYLGDSYRVHSVCMTDNHIDTTLVPLRPGCMLMRPSITDRKDELLPEFLKSWDVIRAPTPRESQFPIYSKQTIQLAGTGVDNNVLSLDEDRVLVNETYTTLIRELERRKFTPIPVRLRHRRIFGGGIHCMSLDVRRRGPLEAYR